MADKEPPKKKSRFFKHMKDKFTSSKKESVIDPTKKHLPQIIVPVSHNTLPPRVQLSGSGQPFIQQPTAVGNGNYLNPTQLQVNLVSPRTETSVAFQKLSVEDHSQTPKGTLQGNHGTPDVVRTTSPDICTSPQVRDTEHGSVRNESRQDYNPASPSTPTPTKKTKFINDGEKTCHFNQEASDKLTANVIERRPIIIESPLVARAAPPSTVCQENQSDRQHLSPSARAFQACSPSTLLSQSEVDYGPSTVPKAHPRGFRTPRDFTNPERSPSQQYHRSTGTGRRFPDTSANLYTSRDYMEYQNRNTNPRDVSPKKRKLDDMIGDTGVLPPPAYIYQRTGNASFNIFDGMLLYPELCYQLALHLPVNDLISLYAISKDYHTILDTRITTVMVSIAEHLVPTGARVFPLRSYLHLSRRDPARRLPHPDPKLAALGVPRNVPSFRWLKMLLHREKVVHEIMALAAQRGVPFPRRCHEVLLKLWYILDIPDNPTRIGYVHVPNNMSDLDLYFGMCIMVKLDMLFNDPVGTEKRDGARRLILSQRSLTPLLLVLKREIWTTKIEILQEWIKYRYEPSERDKDECERTGIMGVPLHECGMLKYPYWGESRKLAELRFEAKKKGNNDADWLLRPDQMIVREAVRRGLSFRGHVLRCLLFGYVDLKTLDDVDFAAEGRDVWRRERLLEEHGEYDFDGMVGGSRSLAVDDGGDRLLDLGRRRLGSRRIKREEIGEQERCWRGGEEEFTQQCYAWWRSEMTDAGLNVEDLASDEIV